MRKIVLFFSLLIAFLALAMLSANSYSMEYTQVGNKLVLKEKVNGLQISNSVLSEPLDKSSGGYYFVKKIIFNQDYSEVTVKLNLDTGFILEKEGVFPDGYSVESDGQIISVVWKLNNVKFGYVFPIFVKINETKKVSYSLLIGLAVILIVPIVYLIFIKKFKKAVIKKSYKKVSKTKNRIGPREKEYNYLLDTEKKVIDELKKADRHELWQKQIQILTKFSKAKISRLVRNLESRGLIKKIPFGNTNKVRLN